jgi:hypothetical protein
MDLLWTCCGFVQTPLVQFVVDLFANLLWICCTSCCTTDPQQIEQVEFELYGDSSHEQFVKRVKSFAYVSDSYVFVGRSQP